MELAVGDSTEIEVVLNSKGYKGKLQKRFPVMTTDSTTNPYPISLSAEVIVNSNSTFPVVISPPRIDFTLVGGEEILVREMKIKNVSPKEIKLKVVDSPVGFFKIRFSNEKLKPFSEIELKVELNGELKGDSFLRSVTLELNDTAKTRFTIPVEKRIQ